MGTVTSLGWRDRATRLLLFDTYTRSVLTYGGVVWGPALLPADGDMSVDWTAELGVFYRQCLYIMMGFGRDVRNDVLYILSGHPLLALHLGK